MIAPTFEMPTRAITLLQPKLLESAIDRTAAAAMTVTRLLDRNVRSVTIDDAIDIYRKAI
jgi:hypothetical protein